MEQWRHHVLVRDVSIFIPIIHVEEQKVQWSLEFVVLLDKLLEVVHVWRTVFHHPVWVGHELLT
jgi:hypothetical protein